jgi:hypothetical protein
MKPGVSGANFEKDNVSHCINHLIEMQVGEINKVFGNSRTAFLWETTRGEMGHHPWHSVNYFSSEFTDQIE